MKNFSTKISKISERLQSLIEEMEEEKIIIEEKYDLLTDKEQSARKGEKLQEEIDLLDQYISDLENIESNLDSITD